MPFAVGSIPGPGRPKGSKDKRKITVGQLVAALEQHDYDPVVESINMMRDPSCPYATRQRINELFIKMIYPPTRAVSGNTLIDATNMSINMNLTPGQAPSIEHANTIDATVQEDSE